MADPAPRLRIVIADAQPLFRDAVGAAIAAQPDLIVVGTASEGTEASALIDHDRPDLAVIDANLPNPDGVQTTRHIVEHVPGCHVILVAENEDPDALHAAMEAGARGFLPRSSPLPELIQAVRTLRRGGAWIPERMLPGLITRFVQRTRQRDEARDRVHSLTKREREVLGMLSAGADNDQIARMLVISPQTARTHVQNALAKLGVHSSLEAVAFLTRNGVLERTVGTRP